MRWIASSLDQRRLISCCAGITSISYHTKYEQLWKAIMKSNCEKQLWKAILKSNCEKGDNIHLIPHQIRAIVKSNCEKQLWKSIVKRGITSISYHTKYEQLWKKYKTEKMPLTYFLDVFICNSRFSQPRSMERMKLQPMPGEGELHSEQLLEPKSMSIRL